MSPERKQAEEIQEALKELRKAKDYMSDHGYGTGTNFTFSSVAGLLTAYASLKVAEATKDMYPKEFILWKDMNTEYLPYGNTYYVKDINKHFVGIDLVFEYWKQNIMEGGE